MFEEWRIEQGGRGITKWSQGSPPKGLLESLILPNTLVTRESSETVVVNRAALTILWNHYTTSKMIPTQSSIALEITGALSQSTV